MEYKRFNDTIVLRLDPDDEICESILKVADKENIGLAEINGLGATDDFAVGVYNVEKQKFLADHFSGYYEIVSLTGNLTTMNGKSYLHLHMSAGDKDGKVVGGHLKYAVISATAEIFIRIIEGKVEREVSTDTGLNIFKF
ncbi:MAG: DNA-binding protein [Eubacteriales bacterium]|nr:DNA-binding protein [Eubacteriales bacterium]